MRTLSLKPAGSPLGSSLTSSVSLRKPSFSWPARRTLVGIRLRHRPARKASSPRGVGRPGGRDWKRTQSGRRRGAEWCSRCGGEHHVLAGGAQGSTAREAGVGAPEDEVGGRADEAGGAADSAARARAAGSAGALPRERRAAAHCACPGRALHRPRSAQRGSKSIRQGAEAHRMPARRSRRSPSHRSLPSSPGRALASTRLRCLPGAVRLSGPRGGPVARQ